MGQRLERIALLADGVVDGLEPRAMVLGDDTGANFSLDELEKAPVAIASS